jgi:Fe-S cluster biogenesis protein NfuA
LFVIISLRETGMTLKEKVEKALESVRPHLQADGGNVELIDVREDGIVKVKLTGACGSCPMSAMTLQYGVTNAIKEAVPEVKEVQSV